MSSKKGMKKYPVGVREAVVTRIREGEGQRAISREYGISRYAIQSWLKEPPQPKHRGRKPAKTLQEYFPDVVGGHPPVLPCGGITAHAACIGTRKTAANPKAAVYLAME